LQQLADAVAGSGQADHHVLDEGSARLVAERKAQDLPARRAPRREPWRTR